MRRAITLAVIGFVLVLVVRFPARWLSPLLPHGIHCQQLNGSAWNGLCTGLTGGAGSLGDLSWQLHASQLLRGRLDMQLDLTDQDSYLRGNVALGFGGALRGRDVTLDLPLTSALVASLPAGAHARLHGTLMRIDWTGKFLSEVQGELDIQDFVGPQGRALGSYQLIFGTPGTLGTVRDTGGPVELTARLQLTHDPGYVLEGLVAARPSAAAEFADQLKYLGSPDAAGRRRFSLAGTF